LAEGEQPNPGRIKPILKLLAFTLVVPCSVTVWVPYFFWPSIGMSSYKAGHFTPVGILPIAVGASGYFWCAWDFAFAGRGTPAPIDPPKVLVARGLYRFVRNPMYISVVLVLLGESLLFESLRLLRYALAVWVFFHLFVVFHEEPALRNKFGASYEDYCQAVPRWIPRLMRSRKTA